MSTSGSLRSGMISSLESLMRIRDEAQVHDVAEHVLINLVGAAILDVNVHRRVALHELS
jgi:hypothetical protein